MDLKQSDSQVAIHVGWMVIMRLQKTAKARLELQPGVRALRQRERALLLLSDGQKQFVM